MRRTVSIIFCLLFSLLYGQTYNFRNYTVEHGLAQSQVLSLFQDSQGYLWIGTNSGGVNRFDGLNFKNLTEKDGLANNVVFSITSDNKGNIYFGTNGGLSIYNGHKFNNYYDTTGLPHNRVFCVLRDSRDVIWIGTQKGLCKIENGKIQKYAGDKKLETSPVFTIHEDNNKELWFGTLTQGAFHLSNGKVRNFSTAEGLDNPMVRTITHDRNNKIFIGTIKGLQIIENGRLTPTLVTKGGTTVTFTSSCVTSEGKFWLGSLSGAFSYENPDFLRFTETNGLAGNHVLSLLEDREKNIWIGTDGKGLSKFSGRTFYNYSIIDSLPSGYITSIFEDNESSMWIGVQGNGVIRKSKEGTTQFKPDLKKPSESIVGSNIQSLIQAKDGRHWIATKAGVSVYDGKTFRNYKTGNGLADDNVYHIYQDAEEVIWLATKKGINIFKNDSFSILKGYQTESKELEAIYFIHEDRKRNLWFGTDRGVLMYDRKTWMLFDKRNGFISKRVSNVREDKEGNLWLGTDEGIFRHRNGAFLNIGEKEGLPSNKIYLLLFDSQENLWAGTNKGVAKLDVPLYNLKKEISIRAYGKEEGFTGVECNSNSGCTDKQGRLWFGTVRGVTVYDPQQERKNSKPPLTSIRGIRLFFSDTALSKYSDGIKAGGLPSDLVLPYNKNHVTFDFIGISLTIPEKVKYEYKLEGIDDDWVPPTSKTEVTYSSLPPGKYNFQVRAMNNDNVWNERPVSFSFTVLPPWYRTWWFFILIALIILTSVYLFIKLRTRQLTRAKILLEKEVQERTYELRSEKEKVEHFNREVVEQKAIIEAKNRDITDSIIYAKNIQEALLPPLENLKRGIPNSFVLYLPKDIVSGDFYWYSEVDGNKFIAAVDCTGHGVPGAFMSIVGNTLLNEIVSERKITAPGEILVELHSAVKAALRQQSGEEERRDGMDIALCMIPESNEVIYFAGANRPLWICNPTMSEPEMIKADKYPIGGLEIGGPRTFTTHTVPITKGDCYYIFSDGYADQFGGERGKKFMLKSLQHLLLKICGNSLSQQEKFLEEEFLRWKRSYEQVDDVLVIGFKISDVG